MQQRKGQVVFRRSTKGQSRIWVRAARSFGDRTSRHPKNVGMLYVVGPKGEAGVASMRLELFESSQQTLDTDKQ